MHRTGNRHAKNFESQLTCDSLIGVLGGRKTGCSLYVLLGDRSREHTQRFPRVSIRRCSGYHSENRVPIISAAIPDILHFAREHFMPRSMFSIDILPRDRTFVTRIENKKVLLYR